MEPNRDRLLASLRDHEMFAGVTEDALEPLAAGCTVRSLETGDTLFGQGDAGDALYLLQTGALEVLVGEGDAGTAVDRLAPGAVVGEMALLTDQPRNATVRALEPSTLWSLSRARFEAVAATHPALLEQAHRVMRPRLERAQLAELLRSWFDAADAATVQALQRAVQWRTVAHGEVLYRVGDAPDRVFLVVSGRFRIDGGSTPGREVGRGGSLGGTALLLGRPHGHRATAVRDSQVIEVPRPLVDRTPGFLQRLARDVLGRAVGTREARRGGVRTVALVALDEGTPVHELADGLARRIAAWGDAAVVDASDVDARFGRDGVAQTRPGEPFDLALGAWLDDLERRKDPLVLVAGPGTSAWNERVMRAADLVLLVGAAAADPSARAWEDALWAPVPDVPRELVLIQDDACPLPSGTAAWLEPRSVRAHHHVRLGVDGDLDRLARRVTGRAVALALSGGGARGYVHIGLLRAIQEAHVPVDLVAGSSMGAVVGGTFALTGRHEPCHRAAEAFGDPKKVLDYTLPLVALTRSRKVSRLLQDLLGEAAIEDLWVPFVCVSASLTASTPRLHERGSLWRAVRASAAIPGVFTPLLMDGEVLVDGGVMNNFPVDVARERLHGGVLLASNAYGRETRGRAMAFGDDVDGWRMLAARLLPRRLRRVRAPSMLGTLMRSTSLSSHYLMEEAGRLADLVVRYPTDDISSLEFGRFDELIALGYEHGRAALADWDPWGPAAPRD